MPGLRRRESSRRGIVQTLRRPNPHGRRRAAEVAPGSLEEQVLGLLRARKTIEAVKLYREKTGAGLKEAAVAVETLAKQHNVTAFGPGCAGVLLIVAAAVFILLKYAGAV